MCDAQATQVLSLVDKALGTVTEAGRAAAAQEKVGVTKRSDRDMCHRRRSALSAP